MLNRYVIMARDINARDGAEDFKSTLFSHALISCPTAACRSHVRNNHNSSTKRVRQPSFKLASCARSRLERRRADLELLATAHWFSSF